MRGTPYWMYGQQSHQGYPYYQGDGSQTQQLTELKKMIQTLFKQLEETEHRLDVIEEKLNQAKNIDLSTLLK